jgi:hypothetical protein
VTIHFHCLLKSVSRNPAYSNNQSVHESGFQTGLCAEALLVVNCLPVSLGQREKKPNPVGIELWTRRHLDWSGLLRWSVVKALAIEELSNRF